MMKRALKPTSVLAAMLVLAGCDPQKTESSKTASLDNLVAKVEKTEETNHSCGVTFTKVSALPEHVQIVNSKKRVKGTKEMRKEVLGTLAAAPVDLLRPFMAAGGIIQVLGSEDAAAAACAKATLTASELALAGPNFRVTSCWQGSPARIFLPPSKTSVRKETIRQLSLFFTEYVVAAAVQGQAPYDDAEWRKFAAGALASRSKLSAAFFEDLQRLSPATHDKLAAALVGERRENFVFGEALDSYYCSSDMTDAKSTRKIFFDRYKAAWDAFTDKTDPHAPVNLFGE